MAGRFPTTAILMGGLATRLGDLTKQQPKALVQVAGEPFIAHQLRLLAREGVLKVVLCTGYLGHQIEEFVGDGKKFDISVAYSHDGEKLLGTGGALKKALPLLGEKFGVIYGDSYLDIEFAPIFDSWIRSGKKGLMTVLANKNKWDNSNVVFENGIIEKYDKSDRDVRMLYIDYGLSLLERSAFDRYNMSAFDMSVVIKDLVSEGQLAGFEVHKRFYEIGTTQGITETDAYLRSHKIAK